MADPQDILDLSSAPRRPSPAAPPSRRPARAFLSVWFQCCHTYGRMYRNHDETRYEGRCPRCAAPVHAHIGPDGTSQRIFRAK